MASRDNLQLELETLLGSENVYFQPPENLKMKYPCIRYSLNNVDTVRANNTIYHFTNAYQVTVIDYEPDSEIHIKLMEHFPMCSFERYYAADNLHHFVLNLYY